jgi:cytosine/adenosine deaminase-related metal-dependent hydrolase
MIIRARTILTMDGASIENGAVAVSEHRIVDVGRFDQIETRNWGEIIDFGEQALLPGLINAHCHLDYTCLRGKIPPQKSFADWVRTINTEKATLTPDDYVASINKGFAEAKRFGTTTIANLTAFPELIREIHATIRTLWFAELIDVRAPARADELVDAAIQSRGTARPSGLAPHALFTASKNLYRCCKEIAEQENLLLTTHLAESREEMEMFRAASGPLYELLNDIGRPMHDCGNATPLENFLGVIGSGGSPNRLRTMVIDRPYPRWIVAHLNELTECDLKLLERSGPQFHIVHCPRSHSYFGHRRFQFERLRSLGFNVCLGTDSLASNDNLSLFEEMRAFQKEFPSVSAEDILEMATVNPARALRQENELGRIRPGFEADLIAIPCSGSANMFEQVLGWDGPVTCVMIGGKT